LQVDEQVAPPLERRKAVEFVEHSSLCGQDAVGLVSDDGADEVVLVGEIVIHLRRADTRSLLDVLDAGAGDTVGEHQLSSGRDDATSGCQTLGGEFPGLHRRGLHERAGPAFAVLPPIDCRLAHLFSIASSLELTLQNYRRMVWSVDSTF
jgi:hypothetical protein